MLLKETVFIYLIYRMAKVTVQVSKTQLCRMYGINATQFRIHSIQTMKIDLYLKIVYIFDTRSKCGSCRIIWASKIQSTSTQLFSKKILIVKKKCEFYYECLLYCPLNNNQSRKTLLTFDIFKPTSLPSQPPTPLLPLEPKMQTVFFLL